MIKTEAPEVKSITTYVEYPASAGLADYVECFWTNETSQPRSDHRVLPDGCGDILFSRPDEGHSALQVVGTMSHARVFEIPSGLLFGVRFRPGMAACFVRARGEETADRRLPLADLWGTEANSLREELLEAPTTRVRIDVLEKCLNAKLQDASAGNSHLSTTQQVLRWIEKQKGRVSVDELATRAGLSTRQLLRQSLALTGLTPKQVLRAVRFRHAAAAVASTERGDWAGVAIDCGYYDQAHFINEFRALSGLTPGEYCATL
jgi:AraC-like DNA-binding protein